MEQPNMVYKKRGQFHIIHDGRKIILADTTKRKLRQRANAEGLTVKWE